MLNEMYREIAEILGHEYGLFREFNPNSMFSAENLEKYKHLGVLYVNDGNPNFIPDGASMTISYTLSLCMRVETGQNTSDLTVNPLEKLSTEMTGNVYSEGKLWKYVLNVGLPQGDGIMNVGAGVQFVHYDIPITAIVVSGLLLSNNTKIELLLGSQYNALKAVVTATEIPEVQVENAAFVNDYTDTDYTYKAAQIESVVVASGWGLHVVKLYNPNNNADKSIRNNALTNPSKVYTLRYAMGDETPVVRKVIVSDCTFSNENGQPVVMSFTFSSAMRPL